jgi:uncharacterized Zn-binding protein involved in type VI secretion
VVKPLQRIGDSNDRGGVIISTSPNSTVFNGTLASINGSVVLYGPPTTSTANGSGTVFAHGVNVNYTDNADADGAVRIGGSSNVFVGDDIDQDIPSIAVVISLDEEEVFNPGGGAAGFRAAVESGVISPRETAVPEPVPTGNKNAEPSKFTGTPTADCQGIEQQVTDLAGDLSAIENLTLSPRFTVKKLTRKPFIVFDNPLNPGAGDLTREEIVCNLKLLSLNCLEPIYTRFPNAFVTNTWRPRGIGSPTSQHPRGQAADLQFRNVKKSDYFQIATVIKDLVPYDQLLLEYKTTGSGLPWIHISFNKVSNRKQVLTFLNNRTFAQGLVDLADR